MPYPSFDMVPRAARLSEPHDRYELKVLTCSAVDNKDRNGLSTLGGRLLKGVFQAYGLLISQLLKRASTSPDSLHVHQLRQYNEICGKFG